MPDSIAVIIATLLAATIGVVIEKWEMRLDVLLLLCAIGAVTLMLRIYLSTRI